MDKIEEIKKKINELGPVHPGTLNPQRNRCGKLNCRCAMGEEFWHGPYWQLSWTANKKSKTRHIAEEELPEIKKRVENYKTLKGLMQELIEVSCSLSLLPETKEANVEDKPSG